MAFISPPKGRIVLTHEYECLDLSFQTGSRALRLHFYMSSLIAVGGSVLCVIVAIRCCTISNRGCYVCVSTAACRASLSAFLLFCPCLFIVTLGFLCLYFNFSRPMFLSCFPLLHERYHHWVSQYLQPTISVGDSVSCKPN